MSAQHAAHTSPLWRKVLSLPHTRLGWLSVVLTAVFVALFFLLVVLRVDLLLSFALITAGWLAGGVLGLIAVLRRDERSALVWLAMVAGLPAFVGAGWILLVALLSSQSAIGEAIGGEAIGEAIGLAGLSGVLGGLVELAGLTALAYTVIALIGWLRRHKSREPR